MVIGTNKNNRPRNAILWIHHMRNLWYPSLWLQKVLNQPWWFDLQSPVFHSKHFGLPSRFRFEQTVRQWVNKCTNSNIDSKQYSNGQLEEVTDLNKPETFALSCLKVKRQLHKLYSTKWFEKLSNHHKRKIWTYYKMNTVTQADIRKKHDEGSIHHIRHEELVPLEAKMLHEEIFYTSTYMWRNLSSYGHHLLLILPSATLNV